MKKQKSKGTKFTSIGGQAVIEGIMMKGPKKSALSIRLNNGSILTEEIVTKQLKDKYKILGWPLIRGIAGLIEAMVTGYKILMRSADLATNEEEETNEETNINAEAEPDELLVKKEESQVPPEPQKKVSNKLFAFITIIASILGIAISVTIFFYVPSFLFDLINRLTGTSITGFRPIIEGIMKLALFVGYIWAVSLMKEIHRVFQYHGAEHKTIFCYEAKEELTVENIRTKSRFHPRCGTSFMILMILVGITISLVVLNIFPVLGHPDMRIYWVITKILLVPLFCAFGYEVLKLCGHYDNLLTKIISAPGLWVQRLTTKEPDDSIIEVAIAAMKVVIPENSDEEGCRP